MEVAWHLEPIQERVFSPRRRHPPKPLELEALEQKPGKSELSTLVEQPCEAVQNSTLPEAAEARVHPSNKELTATERDAQKRERERSKK